MVAAPLELNYRPTAITSLKLILLGRLDKLHQVLILRAFPIAMSLSIAQSTDFGLASRTLADTGLNILRLNPFATVHLRAVDTIRRSVLDILLVPQFLCLVAEKFVNML